MDFTAKTDEELLEIDKNYYSSYGQFLEDKALPGEQKKIDALLKKNKVSNPEPEKEKIFSFLKEFLTRQLKKIAIIEYLIMEKNKDFGSMGEQRVSISFCRNLLNIPNNREVTQFDADRFRQLVDKVDETLGKKNGDNYRKSLKEGTISFLGIKIKISRIHDLQTFFDALDFPFYFFNASENRGITSFIFSEAQNKTIGKYTTRIFNKELIRTPNMVLSIAAKGDGRGGTFIRRESCEVIFYNKWQRFFDQSKLEQKKALNHANSAIREGIKAKAMELYGVKSSSEVEKIKKEFINEMIDGILWHELGHKIAEESEGFPYCKMQSAFVTGDSIISVLTEGLGDWALEKEQVKGAFARFLEIAKKDPLKATRCLYVYLSDNWFVDEEEEFMALLTDVLSALALHFINNDGSFDFVRLEKERKQIYTFLENKHKQILDKLWDLIKQGQYEIGIHKIDYTALEKEVFKIYKDQNTASTIEDMHNIGNFWINIMGYVRKFSPETNTKIENFLIDAGKDLRLSILKVITRGDTDKFQNSLRNYIYARYREIGVLRERAQIDYKQAISSACERMKMPEKVQKKVEEQFTEIMNGKNYDISISYEGKPDPFIATVQELMLKSNVGDIKAGMSLGELYDQDEPVEKRKEYVQNELESIRDQIESEMYLEVDLLRVNKKYNLKPMIEELVEKIDFLNGHKLKEKIKEIQYEGLKEDILCEVFVPLKRGYMDWNTSQAVWRINQDLRPDEFTMQWTIDREFLESLIASA